MPIQELQLLLPSDLIKVAIGDVSEYYDETNELPSESRLHKYVIKKTAKKVVSYEPAKLCKSVLTT